jgi:hypothetical protein
VFAFRSVAHESGQARTGVPDPPFTEGLAVDRHAAFLVPEGLLEKEVRAGREHLVASVWFGGHADYLHLLEGRGLSDDGGGLISLKATLPESVVDDDHVRHECDGQDEAVFCTGRGPDFQTRFRISKSRLHEPSDRRAVVHHKDLFPEPAGDHGSTQRREAIRPPIAGLEREWTAQGDVQNSL